MSRFGRDRSAAESKKTGAVMDIVLIVVIVIVVVLVLSLIHI